MVVGGDGSVGVVCLGQGLFVCSVVVDRSGSGHGVVVVVVEEIEQPAR